MSCHTFRELHELDIVEAEWLIATMADYAQSGAAISSSVVKEIFDRTLMRRKQMKLVRFAAKVGIAVHERMGEPIEVRKYQAVYDHVNARLRETLTPGLSPLLF